MKIRFGLFACLIASNGWASEFSIRAGAEHFSMQEDAINGENLVKETGWLPSIGIQYFEDLGTQIPVLRFRANLSAADIDYDGRLQSGQSHQTKTDTTRYSWNFAFRPPLNAGYSDQSLWLGLGVDYWRRNILPSDKVSGLDENYQSRYFDIEWQKQFGSVYVALGYTYHFDSELTLDLTGYDVPKISLPSSHQGNFEIGYSISSNWHVVGHYSVRSIERSDDFTLEKNGQAAGLIAQPKHRIDVFRVLTEYRF